jgi:hypothetical protein
MAVKIDKGFCIQYWKLSYRRKFIRTIWMLPFVGLMFLIPDQYAVLGMKRNIWIGMALAAVSYQAVSTYKKWKEFEWNEK